MILDTRRTQRRSQGWKSWDKFKWEHRNKYWSNPRLAFKSRTEVTRDHNKTLLSADLRSSGTIILHYRRLVASIMSQFSAIGVTAILKLNTSPRSGIKTRSVINRGMFNRHGLMISRGHLLSFEAGTWLFASYRDGNTKTVVEDANVTL